MWNAVSDKDANDPDFGKYIFHYDYKAQQTGLFSLMQTVLWIMNRLEKKFISV